MLKIEKIKAALNLLAGLDAIIDGEKVRARKVTNPEHVPCDLCKVRCEVYENMVSVCSLLDDFGARCYYLEYVLPPKGGQESD